MTTYHQIRDEKLQYDFNREIAKISALSADEMSVSLVNIYYHRINSK